MPTPSEPAESAESASLRRGRIRYFPVAPGRVEFSEALRRELLAERPAVVAVDLPATLEPHFLRAVERLPRLSVVIYEDDAADRAVYLPVEVADPFIEALRTAGEIGAETVFLDPDVGERPHFEEVYPDSYAVRRLGLERYIEACRVHPAPRDRRAAAFAEGLAWKLQGCDPEAEIFVVVSIDLLDPLLDAMERPQARPLQRARRSGARLLHPHPESLGEICSEAPFLQAVYEARRAGAVPARPAAPPTEREARGFEIVESPKRDPRAVALDRAVRDKRFDRLRVHLRLLAAAERLHEKNSGETLAAWQRRLWGRYGRNLAIGRRRLTPSLFDMTLAARAVVDDDFACELWEAGGWYPFQDETAADLPTAKISGEHMWLDTRKIRLRRRLRGRQGRPKPRGLRGKKRERFPGEWRREWRGTGLCSYPPEDLRIEEYGFYLKKKGKSVLSAERSRTEPFTTSLLDGVDLRETLRNWHDGRKIHVRENQRVAGEVGAMVLIFDEDRDDRYPYRMTWLGEHQNESDMAFYATDPFENFAGPGIGRAEYGGLLLSLPPQRMFDVWGDPDYAFAESKPERLLSAALDYSIERLVVYAAPRPPRSIFRSLAARMGRQIVYLPLGSLSPTALKKIRVMHVLDGHERRAEAKDYIR